MVSRSALDNIEAISHKNVPLLLMKRIDPELISNHSSGCFIGVFHQLVCQTQVLCLLRHFWATQVLRNEQINIPAILNRSLALCSSKLSDVNINLHRKCEEYTLNAFHNPILSLFWCWKDVFKDLCNYCDSATRLLKYLMMSLIDNGSMYTLFYIISKLSPLSGQAKNYNVLINQCDRHHNRLNLMTVVWLMRYNNMFVCFSPHYVIAYDLVIIPFVAFTNINCDCTLEVKAMTAKRHCSQVEDRALIYVFNV